MYSAVNATQEDVIKFAKLVLPGSFQKQEGNIRAFMGNVTNFECDMRVGGGAFGYANATVYIKAYDGIHLWICTTGAVGMNSADTYLDRRFQPDDPTLLPFKALLREAIKQKVSGKGLSYLMRGYFKGKRTVQDMLNISRLRDIKEGNAQ